ncbi:TspO and MBR related proteins [Bowdeniella nasicola]|uniref:TspO and MBR related proteins n=1 Tax=Bowdeniella nasicola TaxID=208480 RepID=A0A1H4BKS7_9ACTO|nr:TspO/MBR family protein [Bowdeniella nasicola]SEA48795.1 TspO and MBR related proteins [Bowdeniella nasicola]
MSSLRRAASSPPPLSALLGRTLLYATIAGTTALTIRDLEEAESTDEANSDEMSERDQYVALLATNLALNATWPWSFHRAKALRTATVVSTALTATAAELTRRTWRMNKTRGALLAAYPAWGTLATALNVWIMRENRSG